MAIPSLLFNLSIFFKAHYTMVCLFVCILRRPKGKGVANSFTDSAGSSDNISFIH